MKEAILLFYRGMGEGTFAGTRITVRLGYPNPNPKEMITRLLLPFDDSDKKSSL